MAGGRSGRLELGLDTHLTKLAWIDPCENPFDLGDQRPKKVDLVAPRDQHNNGDVPPNDRLLVLEFPIDGDEHFELCLSNPE